MKVPTQLTNLNPNCIFCALLTMNKSEINEFEPKSSTNLLFGVFFPVVNHVLWEAQESHTSGGGNQSVSLLLRVSLKPASPCSSIVLVYLTVCTPWPVLSIRTQTWVGANLELVSDLIPCRQPPLIRPANPSHEPISCPICTQDPTTTTTHTNTRLTSISSFITGECSVFACFSCWGSYWRKPLVNTGRTCKLHTERPGR